MKVQLPWFGKATGSSAGTIYQSYWGNTYTRTFPFFFHYKGSTKQEEVQASFFDIQRNWLPIYNILGNYVGEVQRRGKNVFNIYSAAVYQVLNPYDKKKFTTPPQYFGLDPRKQVQPNATIKSLTFNQQYITLQYNVGNPTLQRQLKLEETHIMLFNKTKAQIIYTHDKYTKSTRTLTLQNTMYWKETHTILIYIALSANYWVSNFYLSQP